MASIVDAIHRSETGGGRARYFDLLQAVSLAKPVLAFDSPEPSLEINVRRNAAAMVEGARQVLDAVVSRIEGGTVYVQVNGSEGKVVEADVPLDRVAADARVGEWLRVRGLAGSGEYTTKDLVPDPWRRIAERYRTNDIVHARVARVDGPVVLVELLPNAHVLVPMRELDWEFIGNPGEVVAVGQHVTVKLLALDVEARRGIASIKQGYLGQPVPPLTPSPGELAFLACESAAGEKVATRRRAEIAGIVSLEQQIESLKLDRDVLTQRLKVATDQTADLRKQVRGFEDRLRGFDAASDPLASASAFLRATRIEYAKQCDEGTRFQKPLLAMRVGPWFLESVRQLEGVTVDKVLEVCAQVASDRAHQIGGREVHRLRNGPAGTARLRTGDGAVAWRCALQIGTASARRLHWWDVSRGGKRTIEFASVAVHDEMSIPE